MSGAQKFCVDCKWYAGSSGRSMFGPPDERHYCKHPDLVSRVTGQPANAEIERFSYAGCGKLGHLWEAKP
jgi:hypothetical protein